MLDDTKVSELIIDEYFKKLKSSLHLDAAIVGAGPSGLVAATLLARDGFNVAVYESKLAPGGGMWGGGMMFNEIVIQREALDILKMFNVRLKEHDNGYYTCDSVECTSALINSAVNSKVKLFNLVKVVDTVFKDDAVCGLVINWTPVEHMGLHVDPITVYSKVVMDATGHPAELANTLVRKAGVKLNTPSGGFEGERPMNAEVGERQTVENTKEIYNNFFVSGMAANGVCGGFRMGPIFGGMLLSGQKAYGLMKERIKRG
ncbi:TPA: ribose 1,5-bisphosphate isomerase [candidate division WOR-3 bacterium]|jgi:thiamine thiazole synthase|uniref:Thiamine thiazole synthase n=1 Tax=candidate division WOR-3 bacterium TaxID=2052148 RepID=A0A350HAL4_UNCW3|nr:ribose 1,5-bisphosphate isomerase [candidate division WOR-3 bacterium]